MLFFRDEHVRERFPLYRQDIYHAHAFAPGCIADDVDQSVDRMQAA